MDEQSPPQTGTAPRRGTARRRLRASVAAWVAVSLALVGVAATSGPGGAVPDLGFRQVGHWVYSGTLGRVFHVNGASKAVDASGKVEGGRLAGGPAVQSPGSVFVPGQGGTTIEFGKSKLKVKSVLPSGVNELPVGLEVPGGPYYVYRQSGIVQRLSPLATIQLGGSLGDPVATTDGTVWLLRLTDGAVCSLARTATEVSCPDRAPAGHRGALTVIGDRPAFVDTTSSEVRTIGAGGLGPAMPVGTRLGDDAKVAPADADGTLPIVRSGDLLLVDTTRLAPGRQPGCAAAGGAAQHRRQHAGHRGPRRGGRRPAQRQAGHVRHRRRAGAERRPPGRLDRAAQPGPGRPGVCGRRRAQRPRGGDRRQRPDRRGAAHRPGAGRDPGHRTGPAGAAVDRRAADHPAGLAVRGAADPHRAARAVAGVGAAGATGAVRQRRAERLAAARPGADHPARDDRAAATAAAGAPAADRADRPDPADHAHPADRAGRAAGGAGDRVRHRRHAELAAGAEQRRPDHGLPGVLATGHRRRRGQLPDAARHRPPGHGQRPVRRPELRGHRRRGKPGRPRDGRRVQPGDLPTGRTGRADRGAGRRRLRRLGHGDLPAGLRHRHHRLHGHRQRRHHPAGDRPAGGVPDPAGRRPLHLHRGRAGRDRRRRPAVGGQQRGDAVPAGRRAGRRAGHPGRPRGHPDLDRAAVERRGAGQLPRHRRRGEPDGDREDGHGGRAGRRPGLLVHRPRDHPGAGQQRGGRRGRAVGTGRGHRGRGAPGRRGERDPVRQRCHRGRAGRRRRRRDDRLPGLGRRLAVRDAGLPGRPYPADDRPGHGQRHR